MIDIFRVSSSDVNDDEQNFIFGRKKTSPSRAETFTKH